MSSDVEMSSSEVEEMAVQTAGKNWEKMYKDLEKKHKKLTKEHMALEKQHTSFQKKVKKKEESDAKKAKAKEVVDLVIKKGSRIPTGKLPGLKSITLNHFDLKWKKFLKGRKFPTVETLRVACDIDTGVQKNMFAWDSWKYVVQRNMEAIYSNMPNLKHLYLRSSIPHYADEVDGPSGLESIDTNFLYSFIDTESLKSFKLCVDVDYSDEVSLHEFFTGYPKLEKLAYSFSLNEKDMAEPLPKKNTLKHLNIEISARSGDSYEYLKFILSSTPSLEELIVYDEVTSELVEFLARTLKNLKQVIGRGGIANDAMDTLAKLKKAKGKNINAAFETSNDGKKFSDD